MIQGRIESAVRPHRASRVGLIKAARELLRNWRARRKLRALMALEDATLRDIGLTRGDVIWASNLPVQENPLYALSKVSKRRYE